MYITTVLSHSNSCLYRCLAYIQEGISNLRIYVAVTSPYPPDRGVIWWYQSFGSNILSTTSWQINDVLICSWRVWVLNIHSNRKYGVIFSFLVIFSLGPETLLSFQLLSVIPLINSDILYPELVIFHILFTLSYYHRWLQSLPCSSPSL